MARKGNQQKNKVDRHSSSFRKKGSESAVQDKKGVGKADGTENNFKQELQNGNHPGSSSMEGLSEINSVGDESKVRQNSGKFVPKEQQGLEALQHVGQSISSGSNAGDCIKNRVGCDAKEDNQTFPYFNPGSQHANSSFSHLLNRLHLKNVMENVGVSEENGVIRSLRQLFLSISKISGDWLEKQKPLVLDSRNNILNACGFIKRKMQLAYPHILRWLMHLGSLLLVFFLVWLDCALRGIGSFVHMGTVSFISVIWCCILSLIAMVGVFKFSIVLVISALTAAFVGIALGILVLAIMGIVFLWFYGSFWMTTLITILAGLSFLLKYERPALFITAVYSVYCAWAYVGWLGLLLGLNLSFISSDVLIYFVKKNIDQHRHPDRQFEQTAGMQDQAGLYNDANTSPSEAGPGFSADRSPGVPSTSGCTSEDEVIRILNCPDHYSALGFTRFEDVDVSLLKREYRKKAMLVHPDKNMGNEKAAEAFKKLQNAYEVLLDSLKRKAYDDELRSEELLNFFRRCQSNSHKKRGHGHFPFGFTQTETDGEDLFRDSRRIACKKCGGFHIWILTRKLRSCARWCQDCNDFHQAKDGDGWVEQSSRPFMFGLLQKVDAPAAFVCADSKIYDVTEWYTCQGMRVPANAHKPSFHVNTSVNPKQNTGKGASSAQKGCRMPDFNVEESMTEEEFVEWLQNAMQSGMFENFNGNTSTETPAKAGSNTKSTNNSSGSSKRKKKGKKW